MQYGTAQHNYVISVKNNIQRRKHIISEFGKQNIPFEFFDAITPDLMEEKAKEFGLDIFNSPLTKGEIACALSHIALWRLAQAKSLDYIVIFEDDIYLGKNAQNLLNVNYLPKNVDVLKIEKFSHRVNMSIFPSLIYMGRRFYRLKSKHVGLAGYIVSKKGIDYILDKLRDYHLLMPIDDFIFEILLDNEDYHVLQMNPAICIQDFVLNKNVSFISALKYERDIRCLNVVKKEKLTFFKKIIRELKRPFLQLKYKKIYFK
ncbi:glycosyltransferase family 25 protein [Actinobacillus vicugnae]|uniref:glycosyltransferase family 25 protein n=1 Tax=Actinobacillus vicugnae TaxID=2573093 RepID=UPI00124190C8|nr:glycosyltransferase family 25 protein [Actinobacillus vicugnae]